MRTACRSEQDKEPLCKIQKPHLHLQFELLSGYSRHPVALCYRSWCWRYCTDSLRSLRPLHVHVQRRDEHSLRGCSGLRLHYRRFVCHKYNPCWPRTPSSMPALGQMLARRLSLPEPWADTQSPHYFCSGDTVEQLFSSASCSSSEHNVLVARRTWPLSHLNKSPVNRYWLP